jgi:hypothetical protein
LGVGLQIFENLVEREEEITSSAVLSCGPERDGGEGTDLETENSE